MHSHPFEGPGTAGVVVLDRAVDLLHSQQWPPVTFDLCTLAWLTESYTVQVLNGKMCVCVTDTYYRELFLTLPCLISLMVGYLVM